MEIQVGEYVRTKDGVIAKVTATGYGIDCDRDVFDLKCLQMMEIPPEHVQEYVIKHSFNIIDLIEKGDYVNELKIIDINGICNDKKTKAFTIYKNKGKAIITFLKNEEIRSIVTKEQFKAMEYEVK